MIWITSRCSGTVPTGMCTRIPLLMMSCRDKTFAYASAIKAADPSAFTLGPVLWGWCAYFYSALDGCSAGTDYSSHGNVNFVPWYLPQMQAYEQQYGCVSWIILIYIIIRRPTGVALSTAGDAAYASLAPALNLFVVGSNVCG